MATEVPRSSRVWAYLQLARPANVMTAWADVLAGFAAVGGRLTLAGWTGTVDPVTLAWLLGATTGLYAGGVVFNDVFDAALDAIERPERPIPSGRASRRGATLFGGVLLVGGTGAALQVSLSCAALAAAIAGAAVLYDAYGKHHPLVGPVNMGLCRGGNLLLGVSAMPAALASNWYLGAIPVVYIAAVTVLSRGEVHGGTHRTGYLVLALIGAVIGSLLVLGLRADYRLLHALPFVLLLVGWVGPSFFRAAQTPAPKPIRKAVKAGVMALIPLDAALAAGLAGWPWGLLVLLLLPVSWGLGRVFSVT